MKKLLISCATVAVLLADGDLMMATTTSTNDTGLLDFLAPEFKKDTGVELKWVSVGSGKAMELGKNCDVDVLLVHSPAAEKKFVEEGSGVDRKGVMFNDFVIVGAKSIGDKYKADAASSAMKKMHEDGVVFVSRGDKSGTHAAEQKLWEKSGVKPDASKDKNYVESGQGMINTLNIAFEKNGATLSDRGTYYKFDAIAESKDKLAIMNEGSDELKNFYSVISINPKKCEKADFENATKFSNWIVSKKGQEIIAEFKAGGKQLFTPNAGK